MPSKEDLVKSFRGREGPKIVQPPSASQPQLDLNAPVRIKDLIAVKNVLAQGINTAGKYGKAAYEWVSQVSALVEVITRCLIDKGVFTEEELQKKAQEMADASAKAKAELEYKQAEKEKTEKEDTKKVEAEVSTDKELKK